MCSCIAQAALLFPQSVLLTRGPPHMTAEAKRLAREMHLERHISRSAIAKTLGRDLSSVCRSLAQQHTPAAISRPKALAPEQIDKISGRGARCIRTMHPGYEVPGGLGRSARGIRAGQPKYSG